MKDLLKTVTECIDKFSGQLNIKRFAAIIGGEAVILHGIPRTALILCHSCESRNPLLRTVKFPVIPAEAGIHCCGR
jgi:hypothetical protein